MQWYQVDPRSSKWLPQWDLAITTALIFTASVTPFEVALLDTQLDGLFFINCVVDLLFILDLCLQFVLIVPTRASKIGISNGSDEGFVVDPHKIAVAYLRGWFGIDLVSVLVSAFGYIAVANRSSPDGGSDIGKLKALRVLRALRLIKLVRLLRASRIIQRWETRIAINYTVLSLLQNTLSTFIVAHWMACVWSLQARLVDDPMTSWLGAKQLCVPISLPHPPPPGAGPGGGTPVTAEANVVCQSIGMIYSNAFYWAVMTITSIGYGDIAASSQNTLELWVASALMLVSGMLWAQTVGAFCGIITTLQPDVAAFRTTMDKLNRYMAAEGFPDEMRLKLREYFHHQKIVRSAEAQRELLVKMSPGLQGEVAWQVHSKWLGSVKLLKHTQRQFLVELAVNLQAMVFAPGDLAPNGFLYVVYDGIVLIRGIMRGKGFVWGEDMILQSVWLRSRHAARSMSFCACFHVDRAVLLMIAERYPKTLKALRRYAILMALRRQIVLEARLLQASQEKDDSGAADGGGSKASLSSMLHNATSVPAEQTVTPMLGNSAEKAMSAQTLTATAKLVAEQAEQMRVLQANVSSISSIVVAIAERMEIGTEHHFSKVSTNPLAA
jgi:hypothetical protein